MGHIGDQVHPELIAPGHLFQTLSLDLQRLADPLLGHLFQMIDDEVQLLLPEPMGQCQVQRRLDQDGHHRQISGCRIHISLADHAQKIHARQEEDHAARLQDLLLQLSRCLSPFFIVIFLLRLPSAEFSVQEIIKEKHGAAAERKISEKEKQKAHLIRIVSSVYDIHQKEKESSGDRSGAQHHDQIPVPGIDLSPLFTCIFPSCSQFPTPPLHILVSLYQSRFFPGCA